MDASALSFPVSAASAGEAAFFVSPHGRDGWSGRLAEPNADGTDGPFASLERARDAMRATGIRTTYLRGGTHRLSATLELGGADSGTRFFAYPGETPVLSGGQRVTGFTAEGGGLYSAPLAQRSDLTLLIGGQAQRVAQSGDWNPADPARSGWQVIEEAQGGPSRRAIRYRPGDVFLAAAQPGMKIQVFDTTRLVDSILEVASIDPATRTITFAADAATTLRSGGTYRLLNDDSLLRDAGEFAWRSEDGRLVVRPEDSGRLLAEGAVVPRLGTLVRLAGASDVTLQGLTFTETVHNGQALQLSGGGRHTVSGNRFVNVGTAIALSGSSQNAVSGNTLEHLSTSGVVLSAGSNGNRIEGNRISHVGEVVKYAGAIMGDGVRDNLIARNDIAWSSRYGISLKNWNDGNVNTGNLIEHNRILHTGQETADGGAIEMLGRSNANTAAMIRGNWIEDAGGVATDGSGNWLAQAKSFGVYLDDMTNGATVRDNFIKGTGWASVFIHGGDANLVENNFAVLRNNQEEFLRLEWVPLAGDIGIPRDNTVRRNVISAASPVDDYWELWTPGSFQLDGNLVSGTPRYGGGDRTVDGVMVDPAGGNYALRPGTPAAEMGIRDLDWAAMRAPLAPPAPTPTPTPTQPTPGTVSQLTGRGGLDTLVGGSGADWATLGEGGGTCHVSGVETLIGGSGADWVNLGGGGNRVILAAVETLIGGAAGDWVNLGDRGSTMILAAVETLIGGAAGDRISLGDRGNTMILTAIETLIGGGGADWVNLGDRGNSMVLTALETLIGGSGQDAIRLGDRGNTLILTAVETLTGGSGQDRVRLGDRGNALTVSGVETVLGGGAADAVTVTGGSIQFEGRGGADRLTLLAGAGADAVLFTRSDDGSAAGSADGHDTIRNFQTGTDRIAVGGDLRALVDRDGDRQLASAQRAGGAANLATDELVHLEATVSSLADADFGAFRSALGRVATDGRAHAALVIASDGTNGALYLVAETGDGTVAAGEVRMLGLFVGTGLARADLLLF